MQRHINIPRETIENLVGILATASALLRAADREGNLLNFEPSAARCARASAQLYALLPGEKP